MKTIEVKSRKDWRLWLAANHDKVKEVWLVYYKQKAEKTFMKMAPTYQKQFLGWIEVAKRPETKEKRIKESIRLLAEGQKLGIK